MGTQKTNGHILFLVWVAECEAMNFMHSQEGVPPWENLHPRRKQVWEAFAINIDFEPSDAQKEL